MTTGRSRIPPALMLRRLRQPASCAWLPNSRDLEGFVSAGPGRHGDADGFERLAAIVSELEVGARRDPDRSSRRELHGGFGSAQPTPHPAVAAQDKPDLLDGLVGHSSRHGVRRQCEMRHASSIGAGEQSDPDPSGAIASGFELKEVVLN
jgi:hypothetical protein